MILGIVLNPNCDLRLFYRANPVQKFQPSDSEFESRNFTPWVNITYTQVSLAMKRQKGVGLTISRRVTRSTTTLDRNSLTLPVEGVTEIFLRLPLKSIAICRCVCKLWSSILRSQDFTDSFLTKSSAHRPQILFVFEDDREMVFFSSPQPENPEENSYVVATDHLARFPLSDELYGCTNGFFCYEADRIFKVVKDPVFDQVVCNPSTGQSLTLPRLKSSVEYGAQSYLGYDPIVKEFKVLSMESSLVTGHHVRHQVLTLGTKKLSRRLVECGVPHYSSGKWICISGVLYYTAAANSSSCSSMVVCFDLKSEKLSFVNFIETFSRDMHHSTTLVNYNGRLGLLMSRDSDMNGLGYICGTSKSLELWVLQDAGENEWSKHVFILPPLWKDAIVDKIYIAGMVGVHEIVLTPWFLYLPSYVFYYNVKSNTIRKVGIQGMEALQGKRFYTYLNYVENVKLL